MIIKIIDGGAGFQQGNAVDVKRKNESMLDNELSLFALNSSQVFGQQVSQRLGVDLSPHEEREFEDDEPKARPLVSVRG